MIYIYVVVVVVLRQSKGRGRGIYVEVNEMKLNKKGGYSEEPRESFGVAISTFTSPIYSELNKNNNNTSF